MQIYTILHRLYRVMPSATYPAVRCNETRFGPVIPFANHVTKHFLRKCIAKVRITYWINVFYVDIFGLSETEFFSLGHGKPWKKSLSHSNFLRKASTGNNALPLFAVGNSFLNKTMLSVRIRRTFACVALTSGRQTDMIAKIPLPHESECEFHHAGLSEGQCCGKWSYLAKSQTGNRISGSDIRE